MNNTRDFFARVPTEYIRCNINKKYGLSRTFYLVYTYMYRNKSPEGFITFGINQLLSICGCKQDNKSCIAYKDIIKSIQYLADNGMIKVFCENLENISCRNYIEVEILDKFYQAKRYTTVYFADIDKILYSNSKCRNQNLITVYLYIMSYIFKHKEQNLSRDIPEAFYSLVENIISITGLSPNTVNMCLDELVTLGIFIKKETGTIKDGDLYVTLPNIYVVNNNHAGHEIELAMAKLSKIYK